jgi:xanthine dehydrogenase YagS FAD-binding subunit
MSQVLGDGSNGTADHALEAGEMIKSIELPPPLPNERAHYKRAIGRAHAEWPLVEVCVRAVISEGSFQFIRVAAGGVAPVPLRLLAVEAALQGASANSTNIANAARQAKGGANPLPMTSYKLDLLVGLMQDVLEQLAA